MIFPVTLQTIITALMMSVWGRGRQCTEGGCVMLSAECVASDVWRVCAVSSEAGVVQFGARSSLRGPLWPGTARAVVQVDPVR